MTGLLRPLGHQGQPRRRISVPTGRSRATAVGRPDTTLGANQGMNPNSNPNNPNTNPSPNPNPVT